MMTRVQDGVVDLLIALLKDFYAMVTAYPVANQHYVAFWPEMVSHISVKTVGGNESR